MFLVFILSYTFGLYGNVTYHPFILYDTILDNLMFVNIHYLKYKFGKDLRHQKFEGKQPSMMTAVSLIVIIKNMVCSVQLLQWTH